MLGDEDKRWLVVGICLSKVLTPVIRTVVEHEMKQLYQSLIVPPDNIHSQTYSCHLRSLYPSTLTLNYASINNNNLQASSCSYDYSVKDDVSLAKLFVKPFMANFTGFDGSLDLSAALSILCGAPNFVFHAVDIIAKEVRSKVRNEWGHCKSSTWTEDYYLDCFLLMEKLVKALNLRAVTLDQANILEELETWRKRGIDMCFGQPINNDILKLVQEEMTTLSKSVEDNKESWMQDHEGLRNHLQNLISLFGLDIKRLEDKQVTLERGIVKLQSRTEFLEEKLSGMSQAEDKPISTHNISFTSGFLLKMMLLIPVLCLATLLYGNYSELKGFMLTYWNDEGGLVLKGCMIVLVCSILLFLYQRHSKGSMLRYWYSRIGSTKGGRTLTFVYTTYNHQIPTVNGVEFSWENLKKKLDLPFDRLDEPGIHYYLNTDRYAYGGTIHVCSRLDNLPQVGGAEVLAVNADCTKVYFEEDGIWKPYRSARNIRCTRANRWF